MNDKVMSVTMVTNYIKKLNSGSSPEIDGIRAEHLKHALGSRIIRHISVMFSLCLKYGIIPNTFCQGLLVPLLKKPTLYPTLLQHYRPVIVSCIVSKLLELYTLDVSGYHEFNNLQFGFVAGRGTNMATSLSNDVITYCTKGTHQITRVHWTQREPLTLSRMLIY